MQLRDAGHDVVYMAEIAPAESDADVIARANSERRLLLTEDKDFGELIFRGGRPAPGIVLLRIDPTMRALKGQRLAAAINRLGANLFDRYTTIEEARFRSRPLRGQP
jgi:predicted nuclease of predicted toxin-antitoxin system